MKNWLSKRPIAVDLSGADVRAVQLGHGGRKPLVAGMAESQLVSVPHQSEKAAEQFVRFLKGLFTDDRFEGRRIALLLPLESVVSFPLRFEVRKGEAVEAAMVQEASKSLPFPVGEAVLDYASLATAPGGQSNAREAVIVAARKAEVDRYRELIGEARGTAEIIDVGLSALIAVHRQLHGSAEEPVILAHIGRGRSLLAVLAGESVWACRTAEWGTNLLRESLVSNLELGDNAASVDYLLQEHGVIVEGGSGQDASSAADAADVGRVVRQVIAPMIEDLVHEFYSLTGYVRVDRPNVTFERGYLYGDVSRLQGFDAYAGTRLDLPVETVDVRPGFGGAPGSLSEYALALGLALREVPWL